MKLLLKLSGLILALSMLLAGCGGGGGGGSTDNKDDTTDTTAPVISSCTATFDEDECQVTVTAVVTDNKAVSTVRAFINGSSTAKDMLLSSGSTYTVTCSEVPEDSYSDVSYPVVVSVTDTSGNVTKKTVYYVVPALTPPDLPTDPS